MSSSPCHLSPQLYPWLRAQPAMGYIVIVQEQLHCYLSVNIDRSNGLVLRYSATIQRRGIIASPLALLPSPSVLNKYILYIIVCGDTNKQTNADGAEYDIRWRKLGIPGRLPTNYFILATTIDVIHVRGIFLYLYRTTPGHAAYNRRRPVTTAIIYYLLCIILEIYYIHRVGRSIIILHRIYTSHYYLEFRVNLLIIFSLLMYIQNDTICIVVLWTNPFVADISYSMNIYIYIASCTYHSGNNSDGIL